VDGGDRLGDPADVAVFADRHELVGVRAPALEHGDRVLADPLAVVGVDEAHGVHPDELVAVVAPVAGGVLVDEPEFPVLQDVDAGAGGPLEAPVEAFLEEAVRLGALQLVDLLAQVRQLEDQLFPRLDTGHGRLSENPSSVPNRVIRSGPVVKCFASRGAVPRAAPRRAAQSVGPRRDARASSRGGRFVAHQTTADAPPSRRLNGPAAVV